jgi:hypothetical protein
MHLQTGLVPSIDGGRAMLSRCRWRRSFVVHCRSKQQKKHQHRANLSAAHPSYDYIHKMTSWRGSGACPPLLLAPMENLADRPYRVALNTTLGGFSEACTGNLPGSRLRTARPFLPCLHRMPATQHHSWSKHTAQPHS